MENNIPGNLAVTLAIIGSGFLSTFIIIINDWVKDFFSTRKQENKNLSQTREIIRKEFLRNIDFIYKGGYLDEKELKKKRYNFLKTYRMMFLYLDDQDVKHVNVMLDTIVVDDVKDTQEMKEKKDKIANSFLTFRKHIIKNTTLTMRNFRHIT